MANPFFKFKQFTVYHDRCAMKVGTDGVLLGAWASVDNVRRVLDIGTGTGLIALMIAQRSDASRIVGIDVDKEAVLQAESNMKHSPWSERLEVYEKDVREMKESAEKFDLIVSNPPFFAEQVYSPNASRNVARHMSCLTFEELIQVVAQLLEFNGCFSVVLPAGKADLLVGLAAYHGLYLSRRTWVRTKLGAVPKRVLMEFVRGVSPVETVDLVIEQAPGVYSAGFTDLLKEFYLAL